jgi:hypothetical protein
MFFAVKSTPSARSLTLALGGSLIMERQMKINNRALFVVLVLVACFSKLSNAGMTKEISTISVGRNNYDNQWLWHATAFQDNEELSVSFWGKDINKPEQTLKFGYSYFMEFKNINMLCDKDVKDGEFHGDGLIISVNDQSTNISHRIYIYDNNTKKFNSVLPGDGDITVGGGESIEIVAENSEENYGIEGKRFIVLASPILGRNEDTHLNIEKSHYYDMSLYMIKDCGKKIELIKYRTKKKYPVKFYDPPIWSADVIKGEKSNIKKYLLK